jgi:hypothetical protein
MGFFAATTPDARGPQGEAFGVGRRETASARRGGGGNPRGLFALRHRV